MAKTLTPHKLTTAQERALQEVGRGYNPSVSAGAYDALERRGLVQGDRMTGYYLTAAGKRLAAIAEDMDR